MAKELDLVAAVYTDAERGNTILTMLQEMHAANTITLEDSALLSKGEDGKIHVQETKEVTGKKGFKRGALAGGLVGILFPPGLIVAAIAGGGLGAVWGKLRDTGLKTKQLDALADKLDGGKVAVVALCDPDSTHKVEVALQGYDGEIIKRTFSEAESAQIEDAAAQSS
jgi:uncharacterized membrane protein